MAAYLLDTCVALWYFNGSDAISAELKHTLRDRRHELYLSDVSVLEVVIKNRLGKLPMPQPPSRLLPPLARKHGLENLPLTATAIYRLELLPDLHRDPFDRLLIAQALTHHLTLVTPDPLIHGYPVPIFWN